MSEWSCSDDTHIVGVAFDDEGSQLQLILLTASAGLSLGEGVAGMPVMLKGICSVDGDVKLHAVTV